MLNDLSQIFLTFLYKNMTVSVVIIAVLLARFLLRKMPKKYSYILWSIVGIRMIFDLPFATNISVFNLFRGFAKHTSTVEAMLAGSHRTNLQGSTNLLNKTDTTGAAAAHASRSTAVEAMTHTLTTSQTVLGILGLLWLIVVALFVAYGIYSYVKCRLLVRTAVIARDITPDSHKKKTMSPYGNATGFHRLLFWVSSGPESIFHFECRSRNRLTFWLMRNVIYGALIRCGS